MAGFNLNASLNEYAFARVVEQYNEAAFQSNRRLVTATQARELHTQYLDVLTHMDNGKGDMYTMATATMTPSIQAMKQVFQANMDYDLGDMTELKKDYAGYQRDFIQSMGWSMDRDAILARMTRGVAPMNGYLPISPFDERFAHRSTVLSSGTEILYAKTSDLISFVPNPDATADAKFIPVYQNIPEKETHIPLMSLRDSGNGPTMREVGMAYSEEDASGLSRLRPYLSDADYRSVSGWMALPEQDRMSSVAMDRSVSILKMLQERGIPYTVSKDRTKGQLKCDVSNTKISIRLTDTKKNEMFIGRVYKDGHSLYLNGFKPRGTEPFVPSVQDINALVEYAIGEHPDRRNNTSSMAGRKVGSPSEKMKYKSYTERERTTYVSGTADAPTIHTLLGYSEPQPDTGKRVMTMIHSKNNHSASHMYFDTSDSAEAFLQDAVASARSRFVEEVDVPYLLQEYEQHGDDPEYVPIFSGNAAISPIQQIYWDVLRGNSELYQPTEKSDDAVYGALFEALGFNDPDDDPEEFETTKLSTGNVVYTGSSAEKISHHLNDSMDVLFGNFEPDVMGKRFNPAMVSAFMDSPFGIYRNNDNLVAAMYKLEFTGDEIRGDDFQTGAMKDRLLRFQEANAEPMARKGSAFMQSMFDSIKSSIEETGCRVLDNDILIDSNGVVQYTAYQMVGKGKDERKIIGHVGQIFEPDAQGVVETNYNGSENKLFTPGYDAYIVPETADTVGVDLMERVRLRGLEQTMKQNISETIRYGLLSGGEAITDEDGTVVAYGVGATTDINNTYRGLYSTVYKVSIQPHEGESLKDTYIRQAELTHLPKEVLDARFETAKGLLHFNKDITENSTVAADYFHNKRASMDKYTSIHDFTNDNTMSAYELTGHSNMAITQNHSAGYTDPVLTGSGKNQGVVRYLVEGASVTADGKIVPTDDLTARAPLMNTEPMRYCTSIPADRVQMVGSNYLTASGVAGMEERTLSDGRSVSGVGMAQLTLQGFTFDDGAVISSDFAKRYGVVNEDGTETRPLIPGDKVCDFAGNKSIIAKVIDRNMDPAEAEKQDVGVAVALFKENPDLDIVQAPYSAVSRFNAASAKLLMENTSDLKLPDGTVHEGCVGFAPVIITHHTAHEHTKQYTDDDVQAGKGRKISAQLGWALSAKGATAIMDECFSGNNSAVSNFREVLNVMGLDMDETGTLRKGYVPHQGEERYLFALPDDAVIQETPSNRLVELFRDSVDSRGGFLELPFSLDLPSGVPLRVVPQEESSRPDRVMYELPVLSAHMRSGQTFEDGTSMGHDYTNQYTRIFSDAVKYLKAEAENDTAEMRRVSEDAKTAYGVVTESLRMRKFDTKHNAMRDDFMSHRMPHSATAVWTPDSNLALDEVGMNNEMAKTLGVSQGEYTMIWRDPILRDYGLRYLKVKIDDNLKGVAVNPLIAVVFDGDFDGDSVGLFAPTRQSAKDEAIQKFSMYENMLDTTVVRENGDYALMLNDSMDVVSAEVADEKRKEQALAAGEDYGETLRERRQRLEHTANEIYKSDMPFEERLEANKALLSELSDWAKDTLCPTCGTEVVSYKDLQSHAQSLVDMVDHGAKGSHKKLADYFKYFGAEFETDGTGHIMPSSMVGVGHTLATAEDVANTELATAIKSHGTGNAGTVSQRVVTVARNRGVVTDNERLYEQKENALSAALKLTYLSTQGLLQAKHDPIQAQHLYDMIQSPIRELWRGRMLERTMTLDNTTTWTVKREKNPVTGAFEPVQATKDEWIALCMELHEDKAGLDLKGCVNPEHVRQVADALCDPNTGRMYDIEDEQTMDKLASPMDILAYRPKNGFDTICKMADEHRNLFEGTYNQMFAPKQIRENMRALETGETMKAIQAQDTKASYNVVKKSKAVIELNSASSEFVDAVKAAPDAGSMFGGVDYSRSAETAAFHHEVPAHCEDLARAYDAAKTGLSDDGTQMGD